MGYEAEVTVLPDIARLSVSPSGELPGFFAIQVDELPLGCDIEWQGLGVTNSHCDIISYATIPSRSSDEDFRTILCASLKGSGPLQLQQATVYTPRTTLLSGLSVQILPCKADYGPQGEVLAAVIVIQHI